jgi:hypothetical protein
MHPRRAYFCPRNFVGDSNASISRASACRRQPSTSTGFLGRTRKGSFVRLSTVNVLESESESQIEGADAKKPRDAALQTEETAFRCYVDAQRIDIGGLSEQNIESFFGKR